MWNKALSYLFSLFNLFYQAIIPCSFPEQLPVSTVDHQQYLGRWYFKAATSHKEAHIQKFKALDNMWLTMEETSNNTLQLTGYMHTKSNCVKKTWVYKMYPGRDDLELEGRTQRRNLLWSGKWANCPECIIFQEIEPPLSPADSEDSLNRFMLYTRQSDVSVDVVASFLRNAACHHMVAHVRLPQEKEFCT